MAIKKNALPIIVGGQTFYLKGASVVLKRAADALEQVSVDLGSHPQAEALLVDANTLRDGAARVTALFASLTKTDGGQDASTTIALADALAWKGWLDFGATVRFWLPKMFSHSAETTSEKLSLAKMTDTLLTAASMEEAFLSRTSAKMSDMFKKSVLSFVNPE